jgi:hypothetical protein
MAMEWRTTHAGPDSWEGELMDGGTTFLAEAVLTEGAVQPEWTVEVLQCVSRRVVAPLYSGSHPTLESAIQAAGKVVRDTTTGTSS